MSRTPYVLPISVDEGDTKKKTIKWKRISREFVRNNEDVFDISMIIHEVKIKYCPFQMKCEECKVENDLKDSCRNECLSLESELVLRNYDTPTSISFSVWDKDGETSTKNNLEAIQKLIDELNKFKVDYKNAVEILEGNIKNEEDYQNRKKISK